MTKLEVENAALRAEILRLNKELIDEHIKRMTPSVKIDSVTVFDPPKGGVDCFVVTSDYAAT